MVSGVGRKGSMSVFLWIWQWRDVLRRQGTDSSQHTCSICVLRIQIADKLPASASTTLREVKNVAGRARSIGVWWWFWRWKGVLRCKRTDSSDYICFVCAVNKYVPR